jgi:putative ABC transport system ATP-binding protein
MKELNRTEHTTFIFSTHDARVMAHASAVVRLADGKLVDRVTAAEAVKAGLTGITGAAHAPGAA